MSNNPMKPFYQLKSLWEAFEQDRRGPEVLFLGDSTLERVSDFDTDRRTLPEILRAELRDTNLVSISYPAYSSVQYSAYVKAVAAMRRKPKVVVLVVNLRSFSPVWLRQPEWNFSCEVEALESFSRHKGQDSFWVSEETACPDEIKSLEDTPIGVPESKLETIGDFLHLINHKEEYDEVDRLREVFLVYHHYVLTKQHEMIRHWMDLIDEISKWGGLPYLYTAPINIEAGRKYVGPDFAGRPIRNIDMFEKLVSKNMAGAGGRLETLSLDFPADQFLQVKHPTEHVNEDGRRILAGKIATGIETLLGGDGPFSIQKNVRMMP